MYHPKLTRFTAFGLHLVSSAAIFASLAAVIILLWYPPPLFQIDGGWEGLRLVAFVDVVLGPLLTLVVFGPGKPGLKLDMSIIIGVQLAALAYGIWTLHANRPALLVFADDRMHSLPLSVAQEMDPSGATLRRFTERPARVMVDIPADPIANAEYILERMRQRKSLHLEYQDFVPLEERWPLMVDDSLDITHYVAQRPEWQAALQQEVNQLGRPADELIFIPLVGRYKSGILIADPDSHDFIGYLDIPFDVAHARKRRLLKDRL